MKHGESWRAVSVDIFWSDAIRDNDELIAWQLMFMRYARRFDDGDLKAGQFDCSIRELCRRFQATVERSPYRNDQRWTLGRTRAFLQRLEERGSLSTSTVDKGRGTTRFTIENYQNWQHSPRTLHERNANATRTVAPNDSNTLDDPANATRTLHERNAYATRTHRETGSRDTGSQETKTLLPETGADDSAALAPNGRASASPKSRGVVVNGERWREELPRDPKTGAPQYPETFNDGIWDVWLRAGRASDRVTPGNKAKTYALCRYHLKQGLTFAQLRSAAISYLTPFTTNPKGTNAKHADTFYAKKNGEWGQHLDGEQEKAKAASYSIDDFPNLAKLGAFLAIAMRAAEVEGAPGRPVPPDQAWEVFQAQSAEIQAQVRAEAGR